MIITCESQFTIISFILIDMLTFHVMRICEKIVFLLLNL